MNHAYTLGDLADSSTKKRSKPRHRVDESVAFSFAVEPNADQHACYLAAIDAMTFVRYEPREYACVKAVLRYPSIISYGAMKQAVIHYRCAQAGLQTALGDDVQIHLVWRGDTSLTDGAVVEVEEVN